MDIFIKALLLGIAAGIIDVIPLVFQGSGWQICIATLLRWLGLGMIITYARMPFVGWLSGLLVGLLTGIPFAVLASEAAPATVVPLLLTSLVLGGLLGLAADKLITSQPRRR
ncbi:MAG: hypothetical protein KUA35_03790 [Pseudodesulfovibrio sp.]|uniref:Uncharacterized protein n=1 Tax=Pseudodesulfovibrio aespoeensis (strain ATCC 700646 / DSM 10631 / Aspo-2) TaxID=643562 RepID=E6VSX0_PSEA9|nr:MULTISPECIES: hypothetical protein [Pseudodesulfovibrio]MBU4193154.1 hypothetical protein [Pseudomonadota bacterium]ADU63214.1 hypothetical protein Daes_2208 [Pseudodesulfovibrio aespoeensis Aspo-2]MBU4243278.1 hypothetical protein [Pseudomonadota bacterium]MBU4475111.1 hypothetical protein [Pseudomonadota bacterium]MBU4516215.1 hypothetical protein [Pseudomonadota bacterium]